MSITSYIGAIVASVIGRKPTKHFDSELIREGEIMYGEICSSCETVFEDGEVPGKSRLCSECLKLKNENKKNKK